jgi:hypothetical protein
MRSRVVAVGIILILLVIVASFLLTARSKEMNWPRYLAEHHCREIGRRAIWASSDTIYRCDNGEIIVLSGKR